MKNPAGQLPWQVPEILPRQPGGRKLWLTSDEHYGHKNIIAYQKRPFSSVEEMDEVLIANHNSVVKDGDRVIHVGDFCFGDGHFFAHVAGRLKGLHFFMDGSHDRAMRAFFTAPDDYGGAQGRLFLLPKLFEFTFSGTGIVLCHYQMAAWKASHHGKTVHFYGHSHGRTAPDGTRRCRDIGVDTADAKFFPVQIEDAIQSVTASPDQSSRDV